MTESAHVVDEQGHVDELIEEAWGIIANAGGGDWTTQTHDWQGAAARWREKYHARLRAEEPHDAWQIEDWRRLAEGFDRAIAHIDALTAASRAVIDGYEERGLIHDVDCEDLTDKVYALRALIP